MAACDRLRPAACRCAAGGAGPLCAHGCGVRCSDLGCVAPPPRCCRSQGWLPVRVLRSRGSWRVGRTEILKLLASAKMKPIGKKHAWWSLQVWGGGCPWWLCWPLVSWAAKPTGPPCIGRPWAPRSLPPRGSYWLPLPFSCSQLSAVHLSLAGSLGGVGPKRVLQEVPSGGWGSWSGALLCLSWQGALFWAEAFPLSTDQHQSGGGDDVSNMKLSLPSPSLQFIPRLSVSLCCRGFLCVLLSSPGGVSVHGALSNVDFCWGQWLESSALWFGDITP